MNDSIAQYREHLTRLSYPEYAYNHSDDACDRDGSKALGLNLSLWNDYVPPGVTDVVIRSLPKTVGTYCLAQDKTLVALLAKRLGAEDSSIIITAGADDALRVASQYCIRSETKTLIPIPSFGRYAYHAMICKARVYYLTFNTYPYELDIVKINNEVHQKQIECLFIASPNNPTGHALSRESINLLLETVQCSVILDESLLMATHSMGSVELVNKYKNLFICGSFSKLYGLAGLRIGYLVANYVHSQQLKKLVSPFGVDALGLEIAKHMVIQEAWLRERIAIINNSIAILQNINSPQLRITHTTAPIALIEYTGTTGSLYDMLLGQGVTTVASEEFLGLDKTNAVRIIIKDVTEILQLKRALANIL